MDFGELVTSAWNITWRGRSVWLLGLFAGTASGSCSGGGGFNVPNTPTAGPTSPANPFAAGPGQAQIDQLLAALPALLPILIVTAIVLVVLYLAFWLLSIVCKGGVIAAASAAAAGESMTLGGAWQAGLAAFGRLFGLEVLLFVLWLIVDGAIVLYAVSAIRGQPLDRLDWLSVLVELSGIFALLGVLASVLGVIVAYAQRAIVLDAADPLAGLRVGVRILQSQFGTSLILWLICLGLSIGGGIALVIGAIVTALPALIVGAIVSVIMNVSGLGGVPALIITVVLGITIAALVGIAILNTFLWHFWTLAYLRLTRAVPRPVPAVPVPETP